MKTMILFFFGMLLICNACGDVAEEPPRTDSIARQYVIPQAKPLTAEEREFIKAKREEYNNAINNVE